MENLRRYGQVPYRIAVVHGGPGAPGSVAPVARALASVGGVLEPLQTASSVDGQVAELADILQSNATVPVTLIGWSWGAWLSFITAARHPSLVQRLVLISSGPFDASDAERIMPTRLSRLDPAERDEVNALLANLEGSVSNTGDTHGSLARLGKLLSGTDTYDRLVVDEEPQRSFKEQDEIYRRVWAEASELRRSGRLLALAEDIRCPVLAIHGDYDPHPFEGVRDPLARTLSDFRFVLLEKCGHEPWSERYARDRFYAILQDELGQAAVSD